MRKLQLQMDLDYFASLPDPSCLELGEDLLNTDPEEARDEAAWLDEREDERFERRMAEGD